MKTVLFVTLGANLLCTGFALASGHLNEALAWGCAAGNAVTALLHQEW